MRHLKFRIRTYLEFRKRAVNQYGLHSPFLFDLYVKCFKPKFKHHFPKVDALRSSLKKDSREIEITDYGAGSLVINSNKREVSQMYKTAAISRKQGELLHRLVDYFKPITVLELGTHLGLSSCYLGHSSNSTIETIEGCEHTAAIAAESMKAAGLTNVRITVGSFSEKLRSVTNNYESLDLVYIDGNHSYEGTMWNYHQLVAKVNENSVIVFDDINWSPEMHRAWEEIIAKPEVSLSINCYKFGIVFFRKGVKKQQFYFKF